MALRAPFAPVQVDPVRVAFPAGVMDDLMPAMDDIPEDFRRGWGDARPWVKFQRDWFFNGINVSGMATKPGINRVAALRHLTAVQGSFEPKHEHKEAAVAFLASLWFVEPPAEAT